MLSGFKLPEPYKDGITVVCEVHLSWMDRFKLLLSGVLIVEWKTLCENPPGKVETVARTLVRVNGVTSAWSRQPVREWGAKAEQVE